MAVEIFVHKMSEHMETAEILEWRVAEGDQVEQYQVIMEVMTDKVTAELEAPAAGIIKGLRPGAVAGAVVPVGEPLGYIAAADEDVPVLPPLPGAKAAAASAPQPAPAAPAATAPVGEQAEGPARASPLARRVARELGVEIDRVPGSGPGGRVNEDDVRAFAASQAAPPAPPATPTPVPSGPARAVPAVRRLARELGVDIDRVAGTGPEGRVTEADVQAAQAAAAPPPSRAETPAVPAAPAAAAAPGEHEGDEWLDLTPVQRITGQRMLESVQTAPQFALTMTVDATNLLWLREAVGERIESQVGARPSVTVLLVRAAAAALGDHPRANASLVQGRVRLHRQINMGVAMGSRDGLVVPVIRDADGKSLAEITGAIQAFQNQLSALRFSAEELSGGTFTISNLGMYGIDHFTAIVNPPQSAILAVGRIAKTPVGLPNDTIALRPLLTMTLTVDHRVMDGLTGAAFLATLRERLEKPYFML